MLDIRKLIFGELILIEKYSFFSAFSLFYFSRHRNVLDPIKKVIENTYLMYYTWVVELITEYRCDFIVVFDSLAWSANYSVYSITKLLKDLQFRYT